VLKKGIPEIRKHEDFVIQSEGKAVLAKRTIYSRVGGDFPTGLMHPSSFSCREIRGVDTNLLIPVFTMEGK
jgi:hypothetical protein